MMLPMSVSYLSTVWRLMTPFYKRKIKFLTKLQYPENIILCKLFENNVSDELATVHGMMSCVL